MPHFPLRDLSWLTLVVAMAITWNMERRRLKAEVIDWKEKAIDLEGGLVQDGWTITWSTSGNIY